MRGLALIAALLLPGMAAAQAITAANYTDPTDRYGHRVLGAGGEWGALTLDLDDGTTRHVQAAVTQLRGATGAWWHSSMRRVRPCARYVPAAP